MGTTTYLGEALLNEIFRGVNFAPPAAIYVSLHTADPGDSGANEVTVVAFPSYAREDAAQGGAIASGWSAPSANAISNLLELLWEVHDGGAAINVTHYGIWDALTNGNCLHTGPVTEAKSINPGDQFVFRVGDIDLSAT